jgi:hypothetical protein
MQVPLWQRAITCACLQGFDSKDENKSYLQR